MVYWIGDINKNTVLSLTESCKWTRKAIANIYIGRCGSFHANFNKSTKHYL